MTKRRQSRVLWRDAADRDVVEIYVRLALDSIEVAERFVDDVEQAVQFVRNSPRAGRLGGWTSGALKGLRVWRLPQFASHLLFYRPFEGGIEVVRILHGARDLPSILEGEE